MTEGAPQSCVRCRRGFKDSVSRAWHEGYCSGLLTAIDKQFKKMADKHQKRFVA